ncbi:MAG: hypothetical protein KDA64_16940 [Rhodospirillaceae bacterium]|nr:hypothetical protein [Rhodospirillaceae bacterium]
MTIHSLLATASRGWRFALGLPLAVAVVSAMVSTMAATPAAAQTLTSIIKPGSPEIAATLCARLHALGVPGARVFDLGGDRVQVEHPAEPVPGLTPAMVNAVLTRPGHVSLHAAAAAPQEGYVSRPQPGGALGLVYIDPRPLMTTEHVERAEITDQLGPPSIHVLLTEAGGARLAEITSAHIGEMLAIVVDGTVVSAPRVMEPILGGSAMITGLDNTEDAMVLAALLTGGPLPEGTELLGSQLGSSGPDAVPTCTSD